MILFSLKTQMFILKLQDIVCLSCVVAQVFINADYAVREEMKKKMYTLYFGLWCDGIAVLFIHIVTQSGMLSLTNKVKIMKLTNNNNQNQNAGSRSITILLTIDDTEQQCVGIGFTAYCLSTLEVKYH